MANGTTRKYQFSLIRVDKLLETVILEDTSYPTTEESSMPSEQLAAEMHTKGPHHEEEK